MGALSEGSGGKQPYSAYAEADNPLELVAIYKVRVPTSSMEGVPTIGGDELVQRLESAPAWPREWTTERLTRFTPPVHRAAWRQST